MLPPLAPHTLPLLLAASTAPQRPGRHTRRHAEGGPTPAPTQTPSQSPHMRAPASQGKTPAHQRLRLRRRPNDSFRRHGSTPRRRQSTPDRSEAHSATIEAKSSVDNRPTNACTERSRAHSAHRSAPTTTPQAQTTSVPHWPMRERRLQAQPASRQHAGRLQALAQRQLWRVSMHTWLQDTHHHAH